MTSQRAQFQKFRWDFFLLQWVIGLERNVGVGSPSKVSAMQHFHFGFIWAAHISCLGAIVVAQFSVSAVNIFERVYIICKLTHLLKDVFKVTQQNHANFFKRTTPENKGHNFLLGYTDYLQRAFCSVNKLAGKFSFSIFHTRDRKCYLPTNFLSFYVIDRFHMRGNIWNCLLFKWKQGSISMNDGA